MLIEIFILVYMLWLRFFRFCRRHWHFHVYKNACKIVRVGNEVENTQISYTFMISSPLFFGVTLLLSLMLVHICERRSQMRFVVVILFPIFLFSYPSGIRASFVGRLDISCLLSCTRLLCAKWKEKRLCVGKEIWEASVVAADVLNVCLCLCDTF